MSIFFGAILPNTKLFGGVKRFFEIGNILVQKGYEFTVLTPHGVAPEWFDFNGRIEKLSNIDKYSFDALFVTEPGFLPNLRNANANLKIFYTVIERSNFTRVAKKNEFTVFANSSRLYKILGGPARQNLVKAIGGINLDKFKFQERTEKKSNDPFTILVYGRFYRKKKGTSLVVKACEKLYRQGLNIKLLLFDSPVDDSTRELVNKFSCKIPFEFFVDHPVKDLASLYHKADIFVSAERNAGWSNTSAEAMACGVPVIATQSGTADFLFHEQTGLVVYRHPWFIQRAIKRLYNDVALRRKLAVNARKEIEKFSWKRLTDIIERYIISKLKA